MKMETEPTEQQRFCKTEARVHIAILKTLKRSIVAQASLGHRHLHARCTFLDPHELSSERGKAPTAGCRSEWSFSQSPTITFCLRQSQQHLCTLALHTPLRCNVREYLLPAAVWRALRPGSAPLRAIDRHRPQQRPCLDTEAATSG